MLVGRRRSVLDSAVKELGEKAMYEVYDITEHDKSEELVERISKRAGAISVLVNNAGILLKKPFTETTSREFFSVFNTHVLASSCLTRAVVPKMLARRRGSILFMASMTSLIGICPWWPPTLPQNQRFWGLFAV